MSWDRLMMKETVFKKMYEESRASKVSLNLHFLIIRFSLLAGGTRPPAKARQNTQMMPGETGEQV